MRRSQKSDSIICLKCSINCFGFECEPNPIELVMELIFRVKIVKKEKRTRSLIKSAANLYFFYLLQIHRNRHVFKLLTMLQRRTLPISIRSINCIFDVMPFIKIRTVCITNSTMWWCTRPE